MSFSCPFEAGHFFETIEMFFTQRAVRRSSKYAFRGGSQSMHFLHGGINQTLLNSMERQCQMDTVRLFSICRLLFFNGMVLDGCIEL